VFVTIPNVLANRYASTEMVAIWSPEAKIVAERRLWLAVLRAQAELGVAVPEAAIADYERVLERFSYPLIRERQLNMYGWVSAEAVSQQQLSHLVSPAAILGDDKLRVLRAGLDTSWVSPTGAVTKASIRLSEGLDALGARSQRDATPSDPLSRSGAGPQFTVLQLTADDTRPLLTHLETYIAASLQSSFGKPLLTSEQVVLGGPGQLSGFDTGAVEGDQGGDVRVRDRRDDD